ncbi:hypothetical protein J4475_00670 [Candidatus Woesearchaeota archaeon]|nr:hypothetical protein [Candidatus Woesearchaeota archaeon]
MKKLWIVGLLLALTLVPVVSAQDFSVSKREIKSTILLQGDIATYDLIIANEQEADDRFRINLRDVLWTLGSRPISDVVSGINIPAGESRTSSIWLLPTDDVNFGIHQVDVVVASRNTGEYIIIPLTVNYRSDVASLKEYLAAVSRIVELPSSVDPRKPFKINVNIDNRNPRDIKKLDVIVESDLFNLSKSTNLGPLFKKVVSFDVALDPLTPPGEHDVKVTIAVDGEQLEPKLIESFEVTGYSDVQEVMESVKTGFLSKSTAKTLKNNGNTPTTETLRFQTGLIKGWFTSVTPAAYSIVNEEGRFLGVDLALQPDEARTVTVRTSYQPIFWILILALLAWGAYYVLRSPVALRKEGIVVATREGGISELKVLVHVKNRSNNQFDRVTIVDRVPNIAQIEQPDVGSLKPSKIFQHKREGTVAKWELTSLERYEDRIISYQVKSKLTILGSIRLPSVLIKYHDVNGREHTAKSNEVIVRI